MSLADDPDAYAVINANFAEAGHLDVLDAGCGNRFPFRLRQRLQITGIDISPESMQRPGGPARRIIGDIQTYRFAQSFDLIVCMNVLEHVPHPERAIDNLSSALKPSGLIVLSFPNPLSLKGLITKFSPHFVHVFILKRVFGYAKAGQRGYAPFPTYLRFALATRSTLRRLSKGGLEVLLAKTFEGKQPQMLKQRSWHLFSLYKLLCVIVRIVSLGTLEPHFSETLVIARRQASTPASQLFDPKPLDQARRQRSDYRPVAFSTASIAAVRLNSLRGERDGWSSAERGRET